MSRAGPVGKKVMPPLKKSRHGRNPRGLRMPDVCASQYNKLRPWISGGCVATSVPTLELILNRPSTPTTENDALGWPFSRIGVHHPCPLRLTLPRDLFFFQSQVFGSALVLIAYGLRCAPTLAT